MLWMFIRAPSGAFWWFGDCQHTPRSADEQLICCGAEPHPDVVVGDDVLGDHS